LQNQSQLSLNQAIKTAEKETRKRGFNLWLVAKLFIPKAKRGYVYLSHMYFRWLDDFVDNPQNDKAAKKNLISRQQEIIQMADSSSQFSTNIEKEYYLYYFIKYLNENRQTYFLKYLCNIIKSFEMDIARLESDGIFSRAELTEYLDLLNEAIFRLSLIFIPTKDGPEKIKGFIGNFFWYILTIRDFKEDVKSGFINISREDIRIFNLNAGNILANSNRFLWLRENFSKIIAIMDEESTTLKKMSLLVKFIWLLSYFNLFGELNRLKYYKYEFATEINKQYWKEIKSFIESTVICLRFSIKVLLK